MWISGESAAERWNAADTGKRVDENSIAKMVERGEIRGIVYDGITREGRGDHNYPRTYRASNVVAESLDDLIGERQFVHRFDSWIRRQPEAKSSTKEELQMQTQTVGEDLAALRYRLSHVGGHY